jgi:hypothetical protein
VIAFVDILLFTGYMSYALSVLIQNYWTFYYHLVLTRDVITLENAQTFFLRFTADESFVVGWS